MKILKKIIAVTTWRIAWTTYYLLLSHLAKIVLSYGARYFCMYMNALKSKQAEYTR